MQIHKRIRLINRIVTKLTAQYEKESASFNHKRDSLMAILQNTGIFNH